jgi:hypothetical protein
MSDLEDEHGEGTVDMKWYILHEAEDALTSVDGSSIATICSLSSCTQSASVFCTISVPTLSNLRGRPHLLRELSQLMTHHILSYPHIIVDLPIVHLEYQPDEVREDRGASCPCLDRRYPLACLWTNDWEAEDRQSRCDEQ